MQELDEFHREPKVLTMFGFSHGTLWKQIAEGVFPKPFNIGPRAVAWSAKELGAHQEKLKAARKQ